MNKIPSSRPEDSALLQALLHYRQCNEPNAKKVALNRLAGLVDQAIRHGIRVRMWKSPDLPDRHDEWLDKVWARLSGLEFDRELLKNFDAACTSGHEGRGRSVYNFIAYNVGLSMLDVFREIKRDKAIFEMADDDLTDEVGAPPQHDIPTQSHTPLVASRMRVQKLVPWVRKLADEMIGKTKTLTLANGNTETIRFSENHRKAWLDWLALEDVSLNGLTEIELEQHTLHAANTMRKYCNEAFAFMLDHPEFEFNLALMVPNKARGLGLSDKELTAALHVMLRQKEGKNMFRKLLQLWLLEYAY